MLSSEQNYLSNHNSENGGVPRKHQWRPNDLIKAILSIRVDLLWNGGIGTCI
ncbi:NAD-glutamate dehydrogenase [Vibrio chagasii]|nr:NAD-glutamate dehydrogenase [Vibrio chagasii]